MSEESRINCWEFMQCGREPGGAQVDELGVCPAVSTEEVDGVNHGDHGGRFCWAVSGTYCKGAIQGGFAQKLGDCVGCDFYWKVKYDEGREFTFVNRKVLGGGR